jgi:putative flippase GtrA
MLISAALMFLCVRVIGMNKYVAKIIVIPITTVINFFMSKLFAFRKKKEKTEKTSEEAKEEGSDGDLEEKQ